MKKQSYFTILFFVFCAIILALSLRGIAGNPSAETINNPEWKESGPLELSPDRGRFALMYSLVEDQSFQFSLPLARFTTPDVGYVNGKYVSLFNPGVSFFIIPGYIIGKYFGAGQVGAFAIIAIFALLNIALIRAIAIRLGASPLAGNLGALAFAFATPAFAYAASLYQHHISTFLLLLAIYAVIRFNNLWSVSLVWFLSALALVVDNPNIFFMLPVALYALGKIISLSQDLSQEQGEIKINIKMAGIITFLAIIFPALFFMWFNKESYGSAFQLPGTIKSVQEIDELGNPTQSTLFQNTDDKNSHDLNDMVPQSEDSQTSDHKKKKTAVGFFKTRNLFNGFYIHLISPDRGILRFSPVILLGIFGIFYLYKRNYKIANLLVAAIGANLLLYSMWGDPWGGWAFGSRYLIPTYAMLGIGVAFAITRFKKNYLFIAFFILTMGYSVWINSLGAITSNTNPPQLEVLALEKLSGHEEKYTYMRNWEELKKGRSKSFVFQAKAKYFVSAENYHKFIYISVIFFTLLMILPFSLGENLRRFNEASIAFIKKNMEEIKNMRGKI
ncbi:MAG: hypothetical protein HW401_393 [Parcubacteria group bacterium]|nr:hypothetical protein [Parcubacteria group bacterium]